jgi:hypothetical protein
MWSSLTRPSQFYEVNVKTSDGEAWKVRRRYQMFADLHAQVSNTHPLAAAGLAGADGDGGGGGLRGGPGGPGL